MVTTGEAELDKALESSFQTLKEVQTYMFPDQQKQAPVKNSAPPETKNSHQRNQSLTNSIRRSQTIIPAAKSFISQAVSPEKIKKVLQYIPSTIPQETTIPEQPPIQEIKKRLSMPPQSLPP